MAFLNGNLSSFGFENLASRKPVLIFTPSAPATSLVGNLFSAVPIHNRPTDATGNFRQELRATSGFRQHDIHYKLTIMLLDEGGSGTYVDFPDWKIYVEDGENEIGPAVGGVKTSPMVVFWQDAHPENWAVRDVWVSPSTGDINRKAA